MRVNGVPELTIFIVTGEQIRAARALARIDQAALAEISGLSLETIKRLERIRGPVSAHIRTVEAIVGGLGRLGVRLDSAGGVSLSPSLPSNTPQAHRPNIEPLHRIVFTSRAELSRVGSMKATLKDIAGAARSRNPSLGVTGVLAARDGAFLQALEGPESAVRRLFGAIRADRRHGDVRVIESRTTASRQFQDWSLCCGSFAADHDVLAHETALDGGFAEAGLTPASALGLLIVVRELEDQPPRKRRREVLACPLDGECRDRICATGARPTIAID